MNKKKEVKINLSLDPFIRVGILHNNFLNGILRPDVPGKFDDVFIAKENLNDAPFGAKVVCRIIEEPDRKEVYKFDSYKDEFSGAGMPKGEIISVLGDPQSGEVAMQGILAAHNIMTKFPDSVNLQIEKLSSTIGSDEIKLELNRGRTDLTKLKIVTIDGEDTKDIDDGLSIEKKDGITYLGVHIADVAHYVKENSPLDKEAAIRGCSVYLADRVVPMLPPILSNNLCSLNPKEIRFALSAFIGFNNSFDVVSFDVKESVIESKKRLTYNQVYKLLSKEKVEDKEVYDYKEMLEQIYDLSINLRKKRFQNGSIDFNFSETKLNLDPNGNVLDIYPAENTFANQMIEECMIACNEQIAKKYNQIKAPFIYRVHQKPDNEKIILFGKVAKLLGEKYRLPKNPTPKDIQKLVEGIKGKPFEETLMQLLLRSMAKAQYLDECDGHFGLALDYYCHFTSPIRRYPDLFVHRVIKSYISNAQIKSYMKKRAKSNSISNTDSEINATIAERESVDFKVAEYMQKHEGETYIGKVVGLLDFGIFVKLPNTVEGMAPFRTLENFYTYHEEDMTVRSKSGKKVIRIGDEVKVKVVKSDIIARRVEFLLDEEFGEVVKNKKNNQPSNKNGPNYRKMGKKRRRR